MNVLVIGSGGREHALVWKIKQSPKVKKVFCIPGNAGIAQDAECYSLNISDFPSLEKFVREKDITLTVVGPEVPLADGLADYFNAKGLPVFGPTKAAAQLEASKVFSKDFMKKHGVATAEYRSFTDYNEAIVYLDNWNKGRLVVKADGLAAGKGVIICRNAAEAKAAAAEIMQKKQFGAAGARMVVEEFLDGEEASLQIFLDGTHYSLMVAAQDHKRVFDNDQGLNTGGMGTYAPAPVADAVLLKKVEESIIAPIIKGLKADAIDYKGVLYIGLMICKGTPYVLEFNCRFGDPETQVVLPLLKSDLVEVIQNVINGTLDKTKVEWYNNAAVCVVMAAKGYPGEYAKGTVIHGLKDVASMNNVVVFHAGTATKNNDIVTSGGRVLGVTGTAQTLRAAIDTAYSAVKRISFDGAHYRKDIGQKALSRI